MAARSSSSIVACWSPRGTPINFSDYDRPGLRELTDAAACCSPPDEYREEERTTNRRKNEEKEEKEWMRGGRGRPATHTNNTPERNFSIKPPRNPAAKKTKKKCPPARQLVNVYILHPLYSSNEHHTHTQAHKCITERHNCRKWMDGWMDGCKKKFFF